MKICLKINKRVRHARIRRAFGRMNALTRVTCIAWRATQPKTFGKFCGAQNKFGSTSSDKPRSTRIVFFII